MVFADVFNRRTGDKVKDKDLEKESPQQEIKKAKQRIKKLEKAKSQQHDYAQALLESESRYKTIFENAHDGIIIHDTQGRIFDVNPTMYHRLGYSKEEMLQMSLHDLVSPEFGKKISQRMKRLEQDGVAIFESADRRKDGTFLPVEVSARYTVHKGQKVIQSVVRDIQERKLAEDLISKTLKDREMLLYEIKQRIKQNHQTYVKTLDHLLVQADPSQMKNSLEAAKSRMESAALIQEKIYRQNNFSRIDFSLIINNLITYLHSQYRIGTRNIQISQEIQNTEIDVNKAIPAALITYELLSNSLEHAFQNRKKGQITLEHHQDKNLVLSIKDDGIGFPNNIDFRHTKTLGMRLVLDLVNQLNGTIEQKINNGTEYILTFA